MKIDILKFSVLLLVQKSAHFRNGLNVLLAELRNDRGVSAEYLRNLVFFVGVNRFYFVDVFDPPREEIMQHESHVLCRLQVPFGSEGTKRIQNSKIIVMIDCEKLLLAVKRTLFVF